MLAIAVFLASNFAAVGGGGAAPAALVPVAAQAAQAADARIVEDQLLLYAVQLDSLTLSDSLAAYGDPADPFLPLSELARLLDLEIDVAPAERRVTGRIGEGARPLIIDLGSNTARLAGAAFALAPEDVAATQTEIYIKASALQRFLPARFDVDGEGLTLAIVPREKLPIQARMERIARARGLGREVDAPDDMLSVASPYELFSAPAFDVILDAGHDTRGRAFSRRFDLRAAGDLLYTGFQGFLGSDDRGRPSDARFLLERRSLSGELPLGATRMSLGDVYSPSLPLGPRSVSGRGFSFTTEPLEQASVFDRIDLRGELPIGFDIELYINDVLRSGQQAPVQGRYEFLDVPLVRGVNVIRIVTYGPRGERAEQVRVVNVGGGQLAGGQTTMDFGVVQQERPMFDLRPRDRIADPAEGGLRIVASVAHGLSGAVTLVGGAALYPEPLGRQRQLLTAGLRTSLAGFAVHGDAALDQRGGSAFGFGLAGQPLGISAVASHFEYRGGFFDENQIFSDITRPLARHSELTLDFTVPSIGGKLLPLSFRGLRDGYAGGGSNIVAGVRASTTIADFLVSTGIDYQRRTIPGAPRQEQLGGILAASRFFDYKWQLRAALDYDIRPSADLRALTLTADRAISDRIAIRFGLGHIFQTPQSTTLQAGATFRLPFGDLALVADYTAPRSDWSIGVRFAFGLGYDRGAGRYRATPPGIASGGSAVLSAFIDRNGNGRFDPGEDPVPDVSVEGAERRAATGADGRAFVVGLGTAPTGRLQVGTDRIENFYVTTPPRTVQFSPRPGKVIDIQYPLTPTGEVAARLLFQREGEKVGLSAVRLLLVRDGVEPRVATTEYDGTAVFSDVPAGTYRLEIEPAQAARLHMRLSAPVTVTVAADGNPVPDVNAEVVFDRRPQGEAE